MEIYGWHAEEKEYIFWLFAMYPEEGLLKVSSSEILGRLIFYIGRLVLPFSLVVNVFIKFFKDPGHLLLKIIFCNFIFWLAWAGSQVLASSRR